MPVYRVYRTSTPFNETELPDVDFEQTADVIYMAHENHDPTKVIRHGHTDWEFASVAFGPTIAAPGGVTGVATAANTDVANAGNAYQRSFAQAQLQHDHLGGCLRGHWLSHLQAGQQPILWHHRYDRCDEVYRRQYRSRPV
jgi:hypothetical protein